MKHGLLVYGEPFQTLTQVLPHLYREDEGRADSVEPDVVRSLLRAVMRREAEVLLADADASVFRFADLRERRRSALTDVISSIGAIGRYCGSTLA